MSTLRTITWEDMFYLVLVATLWRTTSRYGSNMYQYGECWFAAVSCMCIRNDMLCRWWIVNVIVDTVISMVDRQLVITVLLFRCKTLVKVELWTTEMSFEYNAKLINSIHRWIFFCWMDVFVKTILLFTEQNVIVSTITDAKFFSSSVYFDNLIDLLHLQPDQRTFVIFPFVLPKSSTSELQLKFCVLCRDWQHYCVNSDILYNIVTSL